jgi:hypothetical protein
MCGVSTRLNIGDRSTRGRPLAVSMTDQRSSGTGMQARHGPPYA